MKHSKFRENKNYNNYKVIKTEGDFTLVENFPALLIIHVPCDEACHMTTRPTIDGEAMELCDPCKCYKCQADAPQRLLKTRRLLYDTRSEE